MPDSFPQQSDERAQRVLVVDDDANIRRLIIASLKRNGFVFAEASNGREALDLMRLGGIDLVVLDLMMPVVSGWDVLQERQHEEDLKEIPVIVISASRSPEIADAVSKGLFAFLPKPFDIVALNSLVTACLGSDSGGGGLIA